MPRAKTKEELLDSSNKQYSKMCILINELPEDILKGSFSFEDRDKNIRDLLTHLYEWHILLLKWVESNTNNNPQPFLPDGYNWKTYGKLNVIFWEKHQNTSFEVAKELLNDSHFKVMEVLSSFSNEELFTKKHYNWTGSTSLGAYCVSSTASHYDWAIKKIKQHIKTQ